VRVACSEYLLHCVWSAALRSAPALLSWYANVGNDAWFPRRLLLLLLLLRTLTNAVLFSINRHFR